MKKVEIAELILTDEKFPIMKLEVVDNGGEVVKTGYLSPFRGYCFQVSGDTEGNGDYGSSGVIGLANVIRGFNVPRETSKLSIWSSNFSQEKILKILLLGQAYMAVNDWCGDAYLKNAYIGALDDWGQKWTRFIDKTIDYINTKM